MSAQCPCCGGAIDPLAVTIDRSRRVIAHSGGVAYVTGTELRLFLLLYESYPKAVNKTALFDGLYSQRHADADIPDPKILDILICKLRKVLDPIGIVIETMWGEGYGLALALPEATAALRDKAFQRGRKYSTQWDRAIDDELLAKLHRDGLGLQGICIAMCRSYRQTYDAMARLGLLRSKAA
jgi:DNA-binding winged helix-turn-helix (wHTH) protein